MEYENPTNAEYSISWQEKIIHEHEATLTSQLEDRYSMLYLFPQENSGWMLAEDLVYIRLLSHIFFLQDSIMHMLNSKFWRGKKREKNLYTQN